MMLFADSEIAERSAGGTSSRRFGSQPPVVLGPLRFTAESRWSHPCHGARVRRIWREPIAARRSARRQPTAVVDIGGGADGGSPYPPGVPSPHRHRIGFDVAIAPREEAVRMAIGRRTAEICPMDRPAQLRPLSVLGGPEVVRGLSGNAGDTPTRTPRRRTAAPSVYGPGARASSGCSL